MLHLLRTYCTCSHIDGVVLNDNFRHNCRSSVVIAAALRSTRLFTSCATPSSIKLTMVSSGRTSTPRSGDRPVVYWP